MNAQARSALQHYGHAGTAGAVEIASPHRLIQMLLIGALDKIAVAKGAILHKNIPAKGENIGWAISIIDSLRASLNHDAGGELAGNLANLYEYMSRRLLLANAHSDVLILDEVANLLRQIKFGWDGIADQV
ncbi:MAG: flagellar export chaperone FliS [Chromatiales bacterium]|nr:flagellar export chaperone FliS [Gammaproteobacteria bacterium]MBW6476418.1 flagellar export chaperone FliS [Chromatiales bacterium]